MLVPSSSLGVATRRQWNMTRREVLARAFQTLLLCGCTGAPAQALAADTFRVFTRRPGGVDMDQMPQSGAINPYRLPRHVIPSRYDLRLEPNLTALTFSGEETITIEIHDS